MTPENRLRYLLDLLASPGWQVIREVMEKEIVDAAMIIADHPQMTLDEINFRRGAIWSAKKLLELPERLKTQLEGEIALKRPATAGQKDEE